MRNERQLQIGQLLNSTFLTRSSAFSMNRSTEIGCLRVPKLLKNPENLDKVGLIRLPIKVPKNSGESGKLLVRTSKTLFFNRFDF